MISKQTSLDLNGPILSFVQQPQSVSVSNSGSATFVGIATAFFPEQDPPNPASNTGTLSHRWSVEGFGPLTDGTFQGATITGSGTTTLTITNATSPAANGLRLFVGVDYVPSAYSQPVGSAVTVGAGRSTGNAVNEVLNSNTATLTVFPVLSVATQPIEQTDAQNRPTTFTTLGALTDTTQGSISYRWQLNGNDLNDSSTVTGSGTPSLSISLPDIGTNTVRAQLSHPTAGSIFTNTVNFNVVSAREILNFESVSDGGTFLGSGSINLFNNPRTFFADPNNVSRSLVIYPPEKDIRVRITLAAGAGASRGSRGGEGGLSVFEYTLKQNTEYTLKLGAATQPTGGANGGGGAAYLYEKARLIAVCGGGGGSGTSGRGGDGGGVNAGGEFGQGRNSGAGGRVVTTGNLPSGSGAFSSGSSGGQVSGCTIGDHYRFIGFSPCQDVGQRQWTGFGGNVTSQTAFIQRGYKAGLGYRNNGGNGGGNEGGGGSGAYGGNAAVGDGSGGGGGSGYTDGSITLISTRLGGNSSTNAYAIIELVSNNFFVDSVGRILILSAATVGKDPRTLTKTTDRVLPNTDTCIDDARWQQFIELARTQNYRLTATLNNSTTRIISATDNNIRRMINGNNITLKNSLTAWEDTNYSYQLLALAWDETNASGGRGFGSDYSILSWSPSSAYGFGYYGESSNPFFVGSTYSQFTANWWILPPGVPDF